jgi:hypothetical protein
VQDEVFEIHALPPKPDQFSSAQSREGIQFDHRPKWISQSLRNAMISSGVFRVGLAPKRLNE